MRVLIIHYIVEPSYEKTVWFKETLSGIEEKAGILRYRLNQVTEELISNEQNILMVIGTSSIWVSRILNICQRLGISPIIVSCRPIDPCIDASYVLINHDTATRECIDYFNLCGRKSIALFGVNTNSYADTIKTNYFDSEDIYRIDENTSLSDCFDQLTQSKSYNAVLCTNYASAVYLIAKLKNRDMKIPEDVYIVTYGDSVLGKSIEPTITTITLDHKALGIQAVQLYRYIYKSTEPVTVTATVPCRIIPAASTEFKAFSSPPLLSIANESFDRFSSDKDISAIQKLEKLLREADIIDLKIIDLLRTKESIAKVAEKLYFSESSIKYRIKKMLAASGFESTSRMLEIYKQYLK